MPLLDYMNLCLLVVLLLFVTTFEELALDVFPQLTLVVVLVPAGDTCVEEGLESEGTSKDGRDVNRVSLKERGQLEG